MVIFFISFISPSFLSVTLKLPFEALQLSSLSLPPPQPTSSHLKLSNSQAHTIPAADRLTPCFPSCRSPQPTLSQPPWLWFCFLFFVFFFSLCYVVVAKVEWWLWLMMVVVVVVGVVVAVGMVVVDGIGGCGRCCGFFFG